jgi:hypothetical protein
MPRRGAPSYHCSMPWHGAEECFDYPYHGVPPASIQPSCTSPLTSGHEDSWGSGGIVPLPHRNRWPASGRCAPHAEHDRRSCGRSSSHRGRHPPSGRATMACRARRLASNHEITAMVACLPSIEEAVRTLADAGEVMKTCSGVERCHSHRYVGRWCCASAFWSSWWALSWPPWALPKSVEASLAVQPSSQPWHLGIGTSGDSEAWHGRACHQP